MIEKFSYDEDYRCIISEWYYPDRDEYGAPMIVASDVAPIVGRRLVDMLNHFVQSRCERHMSQTPSQLA